MFAHFDRAGEVHDALDAARRSNKIDPTPQARELIRELERLPAQE